MKPERRAFAMEGLRVVRAEGEPPKIVGHAAVFNSLSEDMGGWKEQIMPGAFAGVLGDDVRALWNHDPNHVLGRTRNKTLSLAEDAKGLLIENTPPDTQMARDLLLLIERGDVSQMSFSFNVAAGGSQWAEEGGTVVRTILKFARLWDVSPVTFPAYPETDVAVRELRAWKEALVPSPDLDLRSRRLKLTERGL